MPGDTKIKRVFHQGHNGWVDVDNPSTIHAYRWQARDARRGTGSVQRGKSRIANRSTTAPQNKPTTPIVGVVTPPLTSLQVRLMDRLTTRQGVTYADAKSVIETHGYNATASYGHMREAGATHFEALTVINLDVPDYSFAYGMARAAGLDHAGALSEALKFGAPDADDD